MQKDKKEVYEKNEDDHKTENKDIIKINNISKDAAINIALDTIARNKQAIFFVNTKPSAEKLAEEISNKIRDIELKELSEKIETVLSNSTTQCKRLSKCILRGIAFHHSGLVSQQRELIEDNFKNGTIKIICATPTLAIGVDMPAFRSVIRDLKRYGGRFGMENISVLEYHQMAGRAGRPNYDTWGEAITIAKTESEKEEIFVEFISAESENIYSKLAVEPVLRTYLLSLISSRFVKTKKEIIEFFEGTFWAYQYKDMNKLQKIIESMLELLQEWEFIISSKGNEKFTKKDTKESFNVGFISVDEILKKNIIAKQDKNILNNQESFKATPLGQRVAELYLDPYTAHSLITAMKNSVEKKVTLFSILQMISNTLEMRPLLKLRAKEYDEIQNAILKYEDNLLFSEPSSFDLFYEEFLSSIKTALFLQDWCEEFDEEYLLKKYNIRPGEIRSKLEIADWLIYSCIELAKLLSLNDLVKEMTKARIRVAEGVKEELIPLLKLKGIGRVRARKMYNHNLKDIGDLRKIDENSLSQIIGKAMARSVKDQLGQQLTEPVSQRKRFGQMSLTKYDE